MKNDKSPPGAFVTVHPRRSWAAATAEGRVALILDTDEGGPLAIALSREGIDAIRSALTAAESLLIQRQGTA